MSASSQLSASPVPVDQRHAEIARCAAEQVEIVNRPDVVLSIAPAWLVTLGVEDWECEKRLIEAGA